jgi:hypothetical protein
MRYVDYKSDTPGSVVANPAKTLVAVCASSGIYVTAMTSRRAEDGEWPVNSGHALMSAIVALQPKPELLLSTPFPTLRRPKPNDRFWGIEIAA